MLRCKTVLLGVVGILDSVVMVVAVEKSRFGRPTLLIEARCWSRLA